MLSRARRRHPSIPMCDEWTTSISSFLMLRGTTSRCPLNTMFPWTVSSSLTSKYGLRLSGTSALVSGHPLRITVLSSDMTASSADSLLTCIQRASLTGRVARWSMLASSSVKSVVLTSGKNAQLNVSANFSVSPR